ncbi:MAG TPA: FtsK/SpoIIIE domain-containing protein [Patescibacteria group bacterium]|nr:FtsK/SpoIIIE domain-containing protein [Patescibacteria group bacterium]
MAQPSAEIPTVELPENLGANPCAKHLGQLATALHAFGIPDGMHRVGEFVGLGDNPPPALLAGLGEAHTALSDDIEDIEMARLLLLQMLASQPPGTVRVSVYDPRLTGAFADFSSLGPELFEHVHAGGLRNLLDDLTKHVATLANTRNPVGTITEPWRVVLLMGGEELTPKEREQVSRMIAGGAEWGSIIALGVPLAEDPWLRTGWPGNIPVAPDPPVPAPLIASRGREIAAAAKEGMKPPDLSAIVPAERWTGSAVRGLRGSLGLGPDGRPYYVTLGDENPHALVTGTTGAGKTVTLNALLTSLTQEYGADELSLMMLDFKEGTGVAGYAPNDRDPTWLPHAMLVGTNVNEDPEFAIKALEYLQAQISIRAAAAKRVGAGDYAGLRQADPTGDWKRIVAVIDEFQVLLKGPYANDAVRILTDLSQRARSAGIHLVLASQSVDGISALYAKHGALFTNVSLRIALMGGTMLNQFNKVGDTVPKYHAAINNRMGAVDANVIVRVAAATTDEVTKYKREAHQHRPVRNRPPRVFDGDDVPKLATAVEFDRLRPVEVGDPKVLFADEFSVEGGSAGIDLTRQPGRNAVVIGQRVEEVARVMDTAARSLAKQRLPGAAEFAFVCVDTQMAGAVDRISADLRKQGHTVRVVRPRDAPKFLSETSTRLQGGDDSDNYVFVYGGDAGGTIMDPEKTRTINMEGRKATVGTGTIVRAGQTIAAYEGDVEPIVAPATGSVAVRGDQITFTRVEKTGRESLREVMERGPENGTWVIGSFSGTARMSEVFKVSGITRYDSVGAYVAAGVPLTELNPLTPGAPVTGNAPGADRRNRAQFFDRYSGQPRRTVIPYAIPDES